MCSVFLIAAAGALFVLPASPAAAAFSGVALREVNVTATGTAGQQVSPTAFCNNDEIVVAAGAGTSTITSLGVNPTAGGSRMLRATGKILGPGTGSMNLQATCAPVSQATDTSIATFTAQASPSTLRTGTAMCPVGKLAYAGGGNFMTSQAFFSTSGTRLVGSYPTADGRGWTVTGHTSAPTDRLVIRTLCAPLTGSQPRQETFAPVNGVGQGYANCPFGMRPLTGGAYMTNVNNGDSVNGRLIHTLRVSSSNVNDRQAWFAAAVDLRPEERLVVRVRCIV